MNDTSIYTKTNNTTLSEDASLLYVYDLEIFPNYFLAVFKPITSASDGRFIKFTFTELDELKKFVSQPNLTLVGYNNFNFDDVLIKIVLTKNPPSTEFLYEWANKLIYERDEDKKTITSLRQSTAPWISIDLIQILGGPKLAGSLKSHEIKLGLLNVQDLPYPPGSLLSLEQIVVVDDYCEHDVNATEALYVSLINEVTVRHGVNKEYPFLKNTALRRSNASIAEAVMKHEFERRSGLKPWDIRKPEQYPFNPQKRIDPAIQFSSVHNQQYLERLKNLPAFEATDWVGKKLNDPFLFKVGQHTIQLGSGGLHTIVDHCVVESASILEFDVASYYPSLLRKFDTYPVGLTQEWIGILNELTDARLAAKHSGDKGKADVYKIIINSLYGKLADQFSLNRDNALQLQVTLNGQLFLIMLMERFHDAGFEVISGNTDGLYINAGTRVDEAQTIADQWMIDSGFLLESKTSTLYAATSINDYALYHPEKGWYHKKGQFAQSKRTQPSIITDAVLNTLSSGESINSYIRKGHNLLDLLFSGSVKDKKAVEIKHGEVIVQKTNRWYKSIDGHSILKGVKQTDGSLKWSRIPNSENSQVANRLTDFSIPDDLDFDYYIQEAQTLLDDIQLGKTAKASGKSKLIVAAEKAQAKGFVIVPKGRTGKGQQKASVSNTYAEETIRYWQETPLDQADWYGYQGYGAYTGQPFGVIGIDIDYLDKANQTELFQHLIKGGVVCWHGDFDASEVRSGQKRGTIVFQYDGEQLKTTGTKFFNDYGFEILYGKKVVQLAGFHPNGETYQHKGKLTPIPKALLNYLVWLIPEQDTERTEPLDTESLDETAIQQWLSEFQQIANADAEYQSVGGHLSFKQNRQGLRLSGTCVGHDEHTNQANDQNMEVVLWNGDLRVNCFHQSCRATRKAWEKRIKGQLCIQRTVVVKPENLVIRAEAAEIAQALLDDERYKLVIASTGSGKTHTIVTHILPFLDSLSGNHDKFAIICSSKDQMSQVAERFAAILETDNINEYGIDLIEASGDIRIGRAKSIDSVTDSTRVAITHYTYVSRRRFSTYYYAFLKFMDANTHVFIDEVDAFIESQVKNLPLGSRWRRMNVAGKIKNIQVMKCGIFYSFNNCAHCHMRKYDGHKIDVDNYRNLGYVPVNEFMEGTRNEELAHIDLIDREIGKIRVGNNEVTMLRQTDDPGMVQFQQLGDDPMADFKTIFEDHLNSGYLPTVYRPLIVYDDEEISREDLMTRFGANGELKLADIEETERRKLRFPSRSCNVLTVTLIDRRPLLWMSQAKSVTCLTATLTPAHQRFLGDMLPGLKRYDIPPKDERKMDKIIVVGTRHHLPLKLIIDGHWQFEKMFRFRETLSEAERDFKELSNTDIVVRLGYNKSQFMLTSRENEYGQHKILQTYSFGSLGRGIDFADYPLVDINTGIYKPVSVHVSDDPELIQACILEDRANILTQNIGRILRRPKNTEHVVKMIVLEELESEEELKVITDQLSAMSLEPVESWWIPRYLAKEEIGEWLTLIETRQGIPDEVPKDYKTLIERAKQLIESGANKKEIKQKLRWETVRKVLDSHEVIEVEQVIDQLLDDYRTKDEAINEKVERQREKRLKTIERLRSAGKSDAVIRGDMKVYDKKKPWTESEQAWFEMIVNPLVEVNDILENEE